MQFPPGTRTVPWLPGLGLAGVHPCKNLGLLWRKCGPGTEIQRISEGNAGHGPASVMFPNLCLAGAGATQRDKRDHM